MNNPYKSLDNHAFWKHGVENSDITFPEKIYSPRWKIKDTDKIATMGSCFAQHIANWLRANGFNVPFYDTVLGKEEPMFSANYGNVYTVRQALQLVEEAMELRTSSEIAWYDGTKYIDALRPNITKDGFKTSDEVIDARRSHLVAVRHMVQDFDVLVFTLGLTEAWEIRECETVVPTAPGVIAGEFDPDKYEFVNFRYGEIMEDLYSLCDLIEKIRGGRSFKLLLTVSPVPLTATATKHHVLVATTSSKATLRCVAGDFITDNSFADYFPSFEIINNPAARGEFFESNLRSVKPSAVSNVMNIFSTLALENPRTKMVGEDDEFDPDCEEALLEEFSKGATTPRNIGIVCVGNSHLTGIRPQITTKLSTGEKEPYFFPAHWGKSNWVEFQKNNYLTKFNVKPEYKNLIEDVLINDRDTLILVGMGLAGDAIIRCHGTLLRDSGKFDEIPINTKVTRSLIDFYKHYITFKLKGVAPLDVHASYKKIFWVMSPDMCVDSALARLNNVFVYSGSYLIHKEAYKIALSECINFYQFKKIHFIFHDDSLCDPKNGFTLNEYRANDNPLDIHCNSEYYTGAINEIIGHY